MNEILNKEELDDLLGEQIDAGADDSDKALPRDYDFHIQPGLLQHRFSKLEQIYEKFLRKFKISLQKTIKRNIEFSTKSMSLTACREFIPSMAVPTNINIVSMPPLKGQGLICLDAKLVFSIVECYFGGDGKVPSNVEGRSFTSTEMRVVHKLLYQFFDDFQSAWEDVYKIKCEYLRSEADSAMLTWLQPHEFMLIKKIRVEMEGGGGEIQCVLPISLLDPIKEILEGGDKSEKITNDQSWTKALQNEILEANVEIDCILSKQSIKLKDVVKFKPGDIVPIEIPDMSVIKINNIPVYKVKFGTHEGNYAAKIVKKFNHS